MKTKRWSVVVSGNTVGYFDKLTDANRALTGEIRKWRSKPGCTAVLQRQIYDYWRRFYKLKAYGQDCTTAYIWDRKGER